MDAFFLTQSLTKEKFTGDEVVVVETKEGFSFMKMVQLILSFAISVYAAYLSWSCSTGEHMFIRILSAMFAWMFGVLYILYFALVRSSSCKIY